MWTVETLNAIVDAELAAQPDDIRARLVWISQLIETVGLERMHMPHIDHIDGDIWEIRMRGAGGIARALYITARNQRVVVVRVFTKKSQKTPRSEINLAKQRAKTVR